MGFLAKIKDILFEEEEVEEPIKKEKQAKERIIPKEKEVVTERKEEVTREVPISKPIEPTIRKEVPKVSEEPKKVDTFESERDIFKSDSSFPFLDFDEEEFNNSVSRSNKTPKPTNKPTTNVLEYERKRRIEKRTDYGKTEVREITEKKKFKPSPIISPVYGILNEDYKIDDIKTKNDTNDLDIESVRKKAFEPVEEILSDTEPTESYYEETVTVKVREPEEERKEKVKTIDELLEDTADVKIDVDDDKETATKDENEYDEVANELDEIKPEEEQKEETEFEDEDTLENDLFDLIDSMYDKREDGEEE